MQIKFFLVNYEEILQNISSKKIVLGIIIIALLVFSPIFKGTEFLNYDDNWYIYENPNVVNLSWDSIKAMFTNTLKGQYSPLGELYHSFIYTLFGENATAFKIFALLVHLLNVLLLFKILVKVFESKLFVALIVLFFAIHPMQVETIGWLSVIFRNAVTFMFLGYIFYLKYLEHHSQKYRLLPVLICYILAFLTKEQAILFPVGLFLFNIMKSDSILTKEFLVEMIFWALITLILGLITIEITKTGGPNINDRNVSFYEKFALLSKTILDYSKNFIFPNRLSFSYPYPISKELNGSLFYILLASVLVTLGSLISFKNKTVRFGLLWTFGFFSLAFAFAFFHMRQSYMADRYAYVALIGFAVLFFQLLFYVRQSFANRIWFPILLMIIIPAISITTFNRVTIFNKNKDLWTQALKVNPDDPFANNSVGYHYRNIGKLDTAKFFYKKSVALSPNYFLAHNNLTKVYYEEKQYDSALYHVSKAIALKPDLISAYENRAVLYNVLDKKELYLNDLNTLIKLSPDVQKYRINRANFYFKQKKYKESLKDVLELLKNPSNHNDAIFSLAGNNYLILNQLEDAEKMLSKAIELNAENGKFFYLRSIVRAKSGFWILALKDAVKARELNYNVNDSFYKMLVREAKKSGK